jgi:AraC-like DNA-binding protein
MVRDGPAPENHHKSGHSVGRARLSKNYIKNAPGGQKHGEAEYYRFGKTGTLMGQSAKRYMDRHRIVRSRDMEAVQAFLHAKGFECDVAGRDMSGLDVCINCAVLPCLSVGYLQNGTPTVTRSLSGTVDYQILLPIQDRIEARTGGRSVLCSPQRGVVSSPQRDFWARAYGRGARFRICITEQAVREQLAALLGDVPVPPLEFASAMDLTLGFGSRFARHVLTAVDDFEGPNSIMASPITIVSFEQFIIGELLLYHPHNYTKALECLRRSIAPRDVKRAIDYMHANLDAPLTIGGIATNVGVAGQTLFKHFRDAYGISPIRYVRNLRFEKARQELLNAEAGAKINEIASRWGFGHLGRFSVEYRLRFGESPSETLARRSKSGLISSGPAVVRNMWSE